MGHDNEMSWADPEKQRELRHKNRRRVMRHMRNRAVKLLILIVVLIMVTVGRAIQPPEDGEDIGPVNSESVEIRDLTAYTLEYREPETESPAPVSAEIVEEAIAGEPEETEEALFRDDVPLSYELQVLLHMACDEAGVPYALALAVIEKETEFGNLVGDRGASEGYMQIQKEWHSGRMERLGVTDLMDPYGNFRVGCDFLAELLSKYGSTDVAVTVYNMGHYPGYITGYGREVIANYENWKAVLGDD